MKKTKRRKSRSGNGKSTVEETSDVESGSSPEDDNDDSTTTDLSEEKIEIQKRSKKRIRSVVQVPQTVDRPADEQEIVTIKEKATKTKDSLELVELRDKVYVEEEPKAGKETVQLKHSKKATKAIPGIEEEEVLRQVTVSAEVEIESPEQLQEKTEERPQLKLVKGPKKTTQLKEEK